MGLEIDDEQSCNVLQAEEIMVTIVSKWGLGAASVRKTAVMTLKRIPSAWRPLRQRTTRLLRVKLFLES
jgi:hypothetical protein